MSTANAKPIQVPGKIAHGRLVVEAPIDLPDGEVTVSVEVKPFKGRKVYTVEETAQQESPFPDESEWVAELRRKAAEKKTDR